MRASQDLPDAVKQAIQQFLSPGARLVSLASQAGEETAEETHEALFDHWQLLNDWLNASRDDIRFKRRLESAAHYWDQQGQLEGLLWRPPDLDLLRDFLQRAAQEMTALQNAYWQASDQLEQRRKRNKTFVTTGLATCLALTTLSSLIAGLNVRAANRSRLEAERNNLLTLAQTASTLNVSGGRTRGTEGRKAISGKSLI